MTGGLATVAPAAVSPVTGENQSVSKDSNPTSKIQGALAAIARLCVLAVFLVTLVTLSARYFWLADLFANLRLQQIIAISFAILVSLLARRFRLVSLATICLVIHLVQMGPHLIPRHDADQPAKNAIRLMTVNVLSTNRSHDEIVDEIRGVDPDVVAVIELSSPLQRYLEQRIAKRFPYSVARSQDAGNFGIGLYSKYPLDQTDVFRLNENVDSIDVVCKGYRIIATHPLPPMGKRLFQSRNEHLALLAKRIEKSRNKFPDMPIVAMGDFNLTPWSPCFDDWENRSGLQRARRGLAIRPTWYARGSLFPFGLVLDHVFLDKSLRCLQYRVGSKIGSDHRSVSVTVGDR